jgi:hypothetical protein
MATLTSPVSYAVIEPRHDRESFTISDLSAEFDVTARALRFYEDEDFAFLSRKTQNLPPPGIPSMDHEHSLHKKSRCTLCPTFRGSA